MHCWGGPVRPLSFSGAGGGGTWFGAVHAPSATLQQSSECTWLVAPIVSLDDGHSRIGPAARTRALGITQVSRVETRINLTHHVRCSRHYGRCENRTLGRAVVCKLVNGAGQD